MRATPENDVIVWRWRPRYVGRRLSIGDPHKKKASQNLNFQAILNIYEIRQQHN